VVSAADPLRSLISVFWTGAANFLSSSSSFILTWAEWTPFQKHCYSENLGAPGIEPGTSGLKGLKGYPRDRLTMDGDWTTNMIDWNLQHSISDYTLRIYVTQI
jgi:hypothetical protein